MKIDVGQLFDKSMAIEMLIKLSDIELTTGLNKNHIDF